MDVELRRVVGGGRACVVNLPHSGRHARVEPEPQIRVGPHEEECPGLEGEKGAKDYPLKVRSTFVQRSMI